MPLTYEQAKKQDFYRNVQDADEQKHLKALDKKMKDAVIKTILETNTLKNKPNFIDNFLKSNIKLKGKNVIKKIGFPKK